jgi:hypothetical protein
MYVRRSDCSLHTAQCMWYVEACLASSLLAANAEDTIVCMDCLTETVGQH